jgi:hypothetical protein
MILLDILFFSTILSLIFIYTYVGKFRKTIVTSYQFDENFKQDAKKKENAAKNKEIYESDKYKDIYEDLPWENDDDNDDIEDEDDIQEKNKCQKKYMDESQFISSGDIRRKPSMTIY